MPLKQISFRKLDSDAEVLEAVCSRLDLDKTSVFRMAIRKFAYDLGIDHPDFVECLILLRQMLIVARDVQGADKTKAKVERFLRKHARRLEIEPYPEELESGVLEDVKAGRAKMAENQRLAKAEKSADPLPQ